MNQWIILGEPHVSLIQQLYQISFTCQDLDFSSAFVGQVADSMDFYFYPPIAAISVVVHGRICIQGLIVYLLNAGWKRIAFFYEFDSSQNEISKWLETMPLALGVLCGYQIFEIVKITSLWSGMNFTKLFYSVQNNLDG